MSIFLIKFTFIDVVKKLLAYTLIVSLVLATLYVPVIVHRGYLFNTTNTALYSSISCCEASINLADQSTMNCCGLDMKTLKADINGQSEKPIFAFTQMRSIDDYTSELSICLKVEAITSAFGIRPPPVSFSNRILLSYIQKLVI
ncbi:MAG: hypothetical protein ACI83W_001077 [Marinoscillum sp.]